MKKVIRLTILVLVIAVLAIVTLSGCGAFSKNEAVGIEKIEKSGSEGLVDTYTITLTNGETSTFTVTNGKDGINADGSSADPNAPTPDKYFRYGYLDRAKTMLKISYAYYDMPEKVVIPATHDGLPVVQIGEFDSHYAVKQIVIPKSITSIRFSGLNNLIQLSDIYYEGTKAEWDAIFKGPGWDNGTDNYILHCTDGDFAKGE